MTEFDSVTLSASWLSDWTSEQPTPALRWKGGVLQQAWKIETRKHGEPPVHSREWRDVPTEA